MLYHLWMFPSHSDHGSKHELISTSTPCSLRIRMNWHSSLILYHFKISFSISWRDCLSYPSVMNINTINLFLISLSLLYNQCILYLLFLLKVCRPFHIYYTEFQQNYIITFPLCEKEEQLMLIGPHEFYYTFLGYVDFWLCNTSKLMAINKLMALKNTTMQYLKCFPSFVPFEYQRILVW